MMKITEQERKLIIRRSAGAISQIQEGEDAISVLSGIYCQNLTEKSPRQGELMARELFSWIGQFQKALDDAATEPEEYLRAELVRTLSDLPADEQCAFLRRELETLGGSVEDGPPETLRDRLATEVSRRVTQWELPEQAIPLPGAEELRERKAAKEILGEEMLAAVTAMVIYTMAKNGELSGVPEKLTLAQTAVGVCTEDALTEIRLAARKGYLQQQEAQKKLRALRAACYRMVLAAGVAIAGTAAVMLAKGMAALSVAALCGYLLLWLGVVLGIWYHSNAQMIRDEAEDIPYLAVNTYPIAETSVPQTPAPQKHLPWPEETEKKEETVETHPRVFPAS